MTSIIYFTPDGWKINDDDDTESWYYLNANTQSTVPPAGPWTSKVSLDGVADPPPVLSWLQASAPDTGDVAQQVAHAGTAQPGGLPQLLGGLDVGNHHPLHWLPGDAEGLLMAPCIVDSFAVTLRLERTRGVGLDPWPLRMGDQDYVIVERIHLSGAIKSWNLTCATCNNSRRNVREGDALVVNGMARYEEQTAALERAKDEGKTVKLMVFHLWWPQQWQQHPWPQWPQQFQ